VAGRRRQAAHRVETEPRPGRGRAGLVVQRYAFGDDKLEALEEAARKAKIGLWSQPKPVAPWEWRCAGW